MQRWGWVIQAALGGLMLFALSACAPPHRAPVTDTVGGPRYLSDGRQHRVNSGETLYTIAWLYDLDHRLLAQVNELSPPYTIYTGQKLTVDLRGHQLRPAEPAAARVYQAVNTAPPVSTPVPSTPSLSTPPSTSSSSSPRAASPEAGRSAATGSAAQASSSPSPAPSVAAPASSTASAPASSAPAPADTGGASSGTGPVNWAWPAEGQVIGRFSSASNGSKGINIAGQTGDPVRAAADGEVVYAGSALLRYGDMLIVKHNDRFLSAYAHNRRLLVREGDRVRRGQQIAELGNTGVDRHMLHFEIRDSGKPVDPLTFLPKR